MSHTGIDERRDSSIFTTVNDAGVVLKEASVRNEPASVLEYSRDLPGPYRAVVESTANWYWLSDLLEANGIELVLARARYLKAIAYTKVKTDKVDSYTLA